MKLTIKLFIGLFLLIIGGLFLTQIELKNLYSQIDLEDPYYNYTLESLEQPFEHIKFSGGNSVTVSVEKGDARQLYTNSQFTEEVSYEINHDTLIITISEEKTYGTEQFDPESRVRKTPTVVVTSPSYASVTLENSTAIVDFSDRSMKTILRGNSILRGIITAEMALADIHVSDRSVIFLAGNDAHIDSLSLKMENRSMIELNGLDIAHQSLRLSDSSQLRLDAKLMYAFMQ